MLHHVPLKSGAHMPYTKVFPHETALYEFVKPMASGANRPVLVQNIENGKQYVVKPGGSERFYDAIFSDERILANIACDLGLGSTFAENKQNQQLISFLLQNYNYQGYLACKDMFCGELIRLIAPECTSEHCLFTTEDNKPLVGSEFMDNFQTWKDVYQEENKAINNLQITSLANIRVDNPRIYLPFVGMGTLAVLRFLLGRNDMHFQNWGIKMFDHLIQAIMIDFGSCLIRFRFSNCVMVDREKLNLSDIFDVAKKVFRFQNPTNIMPPEDVYQSPIFRREIFETIAKLQEKLPSIELLADKVFCRFPYHLPFIKAEMQCGVNYLAKFIELLHEEESNIIPRVYALKSTPSYTLFTTNNVKLEGVDYKEDIQAFNRPNT